MTQETYSNNFLQNNGFTFSLIRIPQTIFRCTTVDIPSLTVPAASAPYTQGEQFFPGTANEFDELSLSFLVDENLDNYEELYRWITQQRSYENQVPRNDKESFMVSDGVLVTMTNSFNAGRTFYFKDLFPVTLGTLHFDTSVDTVQPVECTVSFRYSYFELR